MIKRRINFPIDLTLMLIGGKWKCAILCHLLDGSKRTGELRRMMFGITQKVLTEQLRELEHDGLIRKTATPGRVPKVEYAVTDLGESLRQVIEGMCSWGEDYLALGAAADLPGRPIPRPAAATSIAPRPR